MQRLTPLPVSRLAPLAGRVVADLLVLLWSLVILLATATAIGYRASVTPLTVAATAGVVVAFAFCLAWPAILAGLTVRAAESVQALAFCTMLPLTVLSGAFVDTTTVPAWLNGRSWTGTPSRWPPTWSATSSPAPTPRARCCACCPSAAVSSSCSCPSRRAPSHANGSCEAPPRGREVGSAPPRNGRCPDGRWGRRQRG